MALKNFTKRAGGPLDLPDTETLSVSTPSFRQIEGYAPTLLIWFLQLCNFATFSFDGEYLENGEPFSNFCIYMISASSSICILSFRQIDGVRPPTLVKFSKYHATLTLTCAVPRRGVDPAQVFADGEIRRRGARQVFT